MDFLKFLVECVKQFRSRNRYYYAWITFLLFFIVVGGVTYIHQLQEGLIVTRMRDSVSWGFYIGNFTFLVGIAAAAVMLVIPAYIYQWKPIKEVAILGELLAVSAIICCLTFIIVDLGRPERAWHLIPLIGILNFPKSILAWDVLVLNSYLTVNLVVLVYLVYKSYKQEEPNKSFYVPLILLSIPMAISIHTVTAFLYNGLSARPFWNASILAPRFLMSAFCSGPALLIIIFQVLRKFTRFHIKDEAIWKVAELMAYAMGFNLLLFVAEMFKEFYSNTEHVSHIQYLFFGLKGYSKLVPYTWFSIVASFTAFLLFIIPATRRNIITLNIGCILIYFGIYVEKGLMLILPGFTPDALGEIYEYGTPSNHELLVGAGAWCLGALIFTLGVKIIIAITTGELRSRKAAPAAVAEPAVPSNGA